MTPLPKHLVAMEGVNVYSSRLTPHDATCANFISGPVSQQEWEVQELQAYIEGSKWALYRLCGLYERWWFSGVL